MKKKPTSRATYAEQIAALRCLSFFLSCAVVALVTIDVTLIVTGH